MPTFTHGKDAVFKLQGAGGGAPTDLSPFLTAVDLEIVVRSNDGSSFAAAWNGVAVGQYEATLIIEGLFHPTVHQLLYGLRGSNSARDFEYGPQGTGAGAVKITGKCVLDTYEPSSALDRAVSFLASLWSSGVDMTFGTY